MPTIQVPIVVQLAPTDTGLTIKSQVYDLSNVLQSTLTSSTELGSGEYLVLFSLNDTFRGYIKFRNNANDAYLTSLPFPNLDGYEQQELSQLASIKAKTDLITANSVTVVNAVGSDLNVTIRRGDDYSAALSNRLSWSSTAWPSLTDATVQFTVKHRYSGERPLNALSVSFSGTSPQVLSLSLTSANTTSLAVGENLYLYDIQATINGERLTLVSGYLSVSEDVVEGAFQPTP